MYFSPKARNAFLFVLLILYIQLQCIQAASLTPNYKASCTLISTRIYCYSGGYASLGDIVVKRALDEHHYLDLTQTLVLDETSSKWVSISDDSNYTIEPSLASTAAVIDSTRYIVDGGYNETPFIKNITRLFNINSNTWSTISNENRSLSNNAIYMGTAVEVPSLGRIYFWGGLSGQYPGCPVNSTTVLTINSGKNPTFSWSVCPGVLPLGTFTRFGHSATLDSDGINIFYLGGRIRTTEVDTIDQMHRNDILLVPYHIIPMENILTYNTMDATWKLRQGVSNNNMTISSRYMHTASLLPSFGKILIYGGATDDGNERHPSAVNDYLYLLDPKTLEYIRLEDYEAFQGAGPRFGHSAVLCNNTLILLFGVNEKGLITNDVYFLSLIFNSSISLAVTANDNSIAAISATWLNSFSINPNNNAASENKMTTNARPWLSNEAIIGIIIGSVLFAIIVLLAGVIFYLKRLKKDRKEKEEGEELKKKESIDTESLPQLYKQYQRYSTMTEAEQQEEEESRRYFYNGKNAAVTASPNEYDDAITLHDHHTPPRGFSFDHLVLPAGAGAAASSSSGIYQKPNQVKDQQPLTFIEGQKHQQSSNIGSFYLQPVSTTPTAPISPTPSLVKPSI